jgi:hypothetical protein
MAAIDAPIHIPPICNRSDSFTENESSQTESATEFRYKAVNGSRNQVADALKVRNAGAMTCPPDGVTRKMARPR